MKLTKSRPKTEIEQIREDIPNYDQIPLKAKYDRMGNVLKIETEDIALQNYLKSKGFISS